jgi:hypothetical protein
MQISPIYFHSDPASRVDVEVYYVSVIAYVQIWLHAHKMTHSFGQTR